MDQIRLVRKSAAATGTTAAVGTNIFDYTGNSSSGAGTFRGTLSTTGTCVTITNEGTDGDVVQQANFNVLGGYEWNSQPNMRVWVPISGLIAIKLKAVVALTYDCTLVIRESK